MGMVKLILEARREPANNSVSNSTTRPGLITLLSHAGADHSGDADNRDDEMHVATSLLHQTGLGGRVKQ